MSECAIAEFYSYTEPVARKRYACRECHAKIEIGEKHFAWRGKWEGKIITGRQHLLCMEACMMVRDVFNDFECLPFGELLGFYSDCRRELLGHPKFRDLVRLIVRIRRRERLQEIAS